MRVGDNNFGGVTKPFTLVPNDVTASDSEYFFSRPSSVRRNAAEVVEVKEFVSFD